MPNYKVVVQTLSFSIFDQAVRHRDMALENLMNAARLSPDVAEFMENNPVAVLPAVITIDDPNPPSAGTSSGLAGIISEKQARQSAGTMYHLKVYMPVEV